ncbi:MAG: WYL domain-containing protein [Clostridia bacterium]|nr:WYL domain-containing protein [Clostridia bacterium]
MDNNELGGLEPKKLAPLLILKVLQKYSDSNHILTQQFILKELKKDGLDLERKALSRNIDYLIRLGYDIDKTARGVYLISRDFEDYELRFFIDSVASASFLSPYVSKDLIKRLVSLSNIYFKDKLDSYDYINEINKTDNNVSVTLEILNEAIIQEKQVTFDFNIYDKTLKLKKTKSHHVSPVKLIIKNFKYYLIGISETDKEVKTFRVDRISNTDIIDKKATKITTIKDFEKGIDYKSIFSSPYLFLGKETKVELLMKESTLDQIVDWFGTDNIYVVSKGEYVKVTLEANLKAMEYWAMQYLNSVEILSPESLRNKIKDNLSKGLNRYSQP